MKRFFLQIPCAAMVAAIMLHVSPALAQPPDILRDYRFVPSHSDVHVSGGSPHYNMDLSIAGRFGLITGYDYEVSPTAHVPTLVPHAEFVDVHAILFNPLSAAPTSVPEWDLDETLNLSGLTGTFNDPSLLHFSGVDGQGIPIRLDAALRGPLLHLTGMNYLPPTCFTCTQYVGYKVDALAVTHPYADFNLDGVIDHADYSIWRTNIGTQSDASFEQGDANGDGVVDASDYVVWRHTVGPATNLAVFADSGLTESTLPEPATVGLTFAGALFLILRLGGRARRSSNCCQ
jgi:dockerin type I repeat protein